MKKLSLFKSPISNTLPDREITLSELSEIIKNNYNAETNRLRETSDPKLKSYIKASIFDFVTFSGTFSKRNQNDLIAHSGYIGIDIDKVKNLEETKEKILTFDKLQPVMLFTSVSGNGLRAVYNCEYKIDEHYDCFNAIKDILDYYLSIKVDESGKDIARASFICNDPNIVYNESRDFENEYSLEYLNSLLYCVFNIKARKYLRKYVIHKISKSIDGTKANTLFKVALHVGDFISKGIVDESEFFELMKDEIFKKNINSEKVAITTINNGISKGKTSSLLKADEILKLIDGNVNQISQLERNLEDFTSFKSKEFWSIIENKIPTELKNYINQFPTHKEKEIVFLSLIVGISSTLSFISFKYKGSIYYPMLNLFIVGNAGTNKGLMKYGKIITDELDSVFSEIFEKSVGFNLGGNFSYSALLHYLSLNKGHGLIYDSEADILTSNSNKEWGDFSAFIRKSFHHESEKVLRSGEKPIRINTPKVSVLISGTIDQFLKMFPSSENGYYSRIIFYLTSENNFEWIESKFYSDFDESFIENLKLDVKENFIKYKDKKIEFFISDEQHTKIDDKFKEWSETLKSKFEKFEKSIIIRMAIICIRIALTLQVLNKIISNEELLENENLEENFLDVSFQIVEQLIRYSIQLSFNLKDSNQHQEILNLSELNFVQLIKDRFTEFKREDVFSFSNEFGIKQRKLDKILSDKRYFIKTRYGHYRVN